MVPVPTKGGLHSLIENSAVGQMTGSMAAPIGILYDHKVSGESSSKPSLRLPPLNDDHMKAMVSAVMSSRPDPTTIAAGDQYVFPDGGKAGLEGNFMSLFKTGRQVMQKHKRTITILYKFESVAAKREREKDTTEMNVVEQVFMVSHEPMKLPIKDRVGFSGQNTSNGVGPVPMADPSSALKLPWSLKKKIMGENIRRVGGTGGTSTNEEKPHVRKDTDVEPLFYHNMSDAWYADFISSCCFKALIDLTPGDGGAAYACILQGIPMLAIILRRSSSTLSGASSRP